ncbi:hypothetical protein CHARACLAT_014637 [Characodon lateralis]|uniref:Uncharacterized protein n=1 Tax=Characodon lateralis TaxID=208331 RepID=A0ABU7DT15_9TELE|nr:hypothetical protein [Characodon lateralis]
MTFPWLWLAYGVPHFKGDFPEGESQTHEGLKEPYYADMYVQKLPKPDELLNITAGDFHKIDQCVAQQVFDSLNNSVWSSNGASPRCDLWQADISARSTWRYDCSVLSKIKRAKMLLQAWAEGHSRDWSRTWWGLQEYEVKEWVIPCLSKTYNNWVKYQYLAIVAKYW